MGSAIPTNLVQNLPILEIDNDVPPFSCSLDIPLEIDLWMVVEQLSVVALTKLPVELKIYLLLKVAVCVLWIFRIMGLVRGLLSNSPVHHYGDLLSFVFHGH